VVPADAVLVVPVAPAGVAQADPADAVPVDPAGVGLAVPVDAGVVPAVPGATSATSRTCTRM